MGAKLTRTHSSSIDERFLKPVGKYSIKSSDLKKLKKKILDEKLAPFYPGVDTDDDESAGFDPAATCFADEECPICFLNYPALNRSKCCGKGICTECFLQLKVSKGKPTESHTDSFLFSL